MNFSPFAEYQSKKCFQNKHETMHYMDVHLFRDDVFPTLGFENQLFNGIRFKDLPLVNIKVSKNNTILTLSLPNQGRFIFRFYHSFLINKCSDSELQNNHFILNIIRVVTNDEESLCSQLFMIIL